MADKNEQESLLTCLISYKNKESNQFGKSNFAATKAKNSNLAPKFIKIKIEQGMESC